MNTLTAVAGIVATVLVVGAWQPQCTPASESDSEPPIIAGGTFEASGVAHVPNTNQLLFVDDGRTREIFVLQLHPDGRQNGRALSVPLAADVTDLEGITFDGTHFYAVGSQSKMTGFAGDGLVRFKFDPHSRRTSDVERIQGLKAWLAVNVPELHGTERRLGDDVLNIEAIAWDPHGKRLLVGLRAPVVDGHTLIVPIALADPDGPFSRENLRVDGATIHLQLDGDGVRSLEYDELSKAFRVVVGASLNEENRDFRLLEWNGNPGSPLKVLATYSRALKPEGITRATLDDRPATIVVFDVGRFDVID